MKKLLLVSAVAVVPLLYETTKSGIAAWFTWHGNSKQDVADEKQNVPAPARVFIQKFETGKATCENLMALADKGPQIVSLTQTRFIRHGKRDAHDDVLAPDERAWLIECDRRAEVEQCVEAFVDALRATRRVEAIEAFSRDLANNKSLTDAAKNNLSRYCQERVDAEKKGEEARKAYSKATISSGFAECIKCCDDFLSTGYSFPFTKLRSEIETLRQKAREKFDWHSFLESQEDDVRKLERINEFITKYPACHHLGEVETYRRKLRANVDWRKALEDQLEPIEKIRQLHRFVENYPDDSRCREAADKANNLLEGLFRAELLSPKEVLPVIRLVSRRNLHVTIGELLEQDNEKIVLLSEGKRMTFLRSSLAGEPVYTDEQNRRKEFNAELAKAAYSLKKWDARVLESFAQSCRTLQFEDEAVYVAGLAEIVKVCPEFQKLASGGSNLSKESCAPPQ